MDAVCRFCRGPFSEDDPPVPVTSYWGAAKDVTHERCRVAGLKDEAYECQKIDADCNDCRDFRAYRKGEPGYAVTKHARRGWCQRFDRETVAFPVFCSGRACFTHRRDA